MQVSMNKKPYIRPERKGKLRFSKFMMYTVLILWSLTTIYPMFWVVNNSFKQSRDVMNNSFSIAFDPIWLNYENAFSRIDIGKSYINSLIMSTSTVFLVLLFGGMAAYILARFDFKGKKLIYSILYGTLLIPTFATVVPVYELLIKTSLVNTYLGLILPQTAGNLTFATLVIAGYMSTIPKDLEDAAFIDGSSRWQMLTRVFVPISKPVFASASIFVFLWSYNDLFSALIFVNKENVRPIVALLNEISSQYGTDFGLMATAVTLTVIPVLIVYLFTSRLIEKGLSEGAVKG